jgi:hypothetical protein
MTTCGVDFFNIDTAAFVNVKDYHKIIENIKMLNRKLSKDVGIIAELRGRKLKADSVVFPASEDSDEQFIVLKKGTSIAITNSHGKTNRDSLFSENNSHSVKIIVKARDLHRMLDVGDKIILNDNKGRLTVESVKELHRKDSGNNNNLEKLFSMVRKSKTQDHLDGVDHEKLFHAPRKNSLTLIYNEPDNNEVIEYFHDIDSIDERVQYLDTHDDIPDISQYEVDKINLMRKRSTLLKSKSNFQESKYEINCTVDFDCPFNINSFLFIPNIDFVKHGIDILSCREVAEIASLINLKVNFICISIGCNKDIESIKETLGEQPGVKILASIYDYRSLNYIDDILTFADGIVVSRTFQIINTDIKVKSVNLTNALIKKAREYSKPIYTYIDIDEEAIINKQNIKTFNKYHTLFDLTDKYDGFILNIKFSGKHVDATCHLINELVLFLKENHREGSEYIDTKKRNLITSKSMKYDLLYNYANSLKDSVLVYIGNKACDLQIFHILNVNNAKVVITDNVDLLLSSKLYYNVFVYYCSNPGLFDPKLIKDFVLKRFNSNTMILMNCLSDITKINIIN